MDEGGIHRRLSRITAEAKVDVTLHGLRRSFATINTEKGMPIPIAQQLLRHSNIKTTMEYILIDEQTAVDYLKVKPQGV